MMAMRVSIALISLLVGCSGAGGSGSGSGGAPGGGGSSGSDGGGTGGQAGGPPSPFSSELCNDAFCWEEPKPFGGLVNGMARTTSSVWAVGEGMIAKRTDGVWTAAPSPDSLGLSAVFAFSDENVWAVGAQGAIVHFDGTVITRADSPTTSTLYGIWGAAPDDIWAVGEDGALVHFDGNAWSFVPGGEDELHAVWGSGPNDVYTVGGTFNLGTMGHFTNAVWLFGSTGLSGAGLNAVAGTDANNVFAVGSYGYLYRLDPNLGMEYLAQAGTHLFGLVALSPNELIAVSLDSLFRYSDGGFQELEPIGGRALVHDPAENRFWIGGAGIATYTQEPELVTSEIAAPRFQNVWLGSGDRGIALTTENELLTRDGGNWANVSAGNLSISYGSIVGGLSDGARVLLNTSAEPASAYLVQGQEASALPDPPDALYTLDTFVAGFDPSDFWIFLSATAMHFDGSSWQTMALPGAFTPRAAHVVAANDVWLVGRLENANEGGTVAHFDGTSWTRQVVGPSPTEFTSVTTLGGKVYVAGNWSDVTMERNIGGFYFNPKEPVFYEQTPSGWTQLSIPGGEQDFYGPARVFLTASTSELYLVLESPHAKVPNLLVYDGASFTPRPYPATACTGAFFTDGKLRLVAGNEPYGILRSR
jgi:hypothetical protein